MSFVAIAIGTVAATTLYSADRSRRAANQQADAVRAQQEDDARKTAEAETSAQVAANARLADSKRRRRASALELGGVADTLGGTAGGTVLAAGGPTPASRAATAVPGTAAAYSGGTALGAGASITRAGGGGRRSGSSATSAAL